MGGKDRIDHSSISLEVNEFSTWNEDDSDDECDCPGPPPEFYLPPPPWPHCVSDFRCVDNGVSEIEICKTFSVISDEYSESSTLTPLLVIPIFAVVVFLFIGIILVIGRRNKVQQMNSRQSSISYCESAIASSIIYEDMTDIHLREVTSLGSPCQLRSSEMIRISSCTSQKTLSPVLTCSSLSRPKSHRSKDLFSPVYEEFANVYEEKRRRGSEGILDDFNNGDECEEDEISPQGRVENYPNLVGDSKSTLLLETDVAQVLKNLDFPVADDRSTFLGSPEKNLNSVSCRKKEGRIYQGVDLCGFDTEKRLERSDKKIERKNRVYSDSNSCCSRTDDGVFLKKLFQCYPSAPETDSVCSIRPPLNTKQRERHFLFSGRHNNYSREIIFTTLKRDKGLGQDSYL